MDEMVKLNVLNGQAMYDYYKLHELDEEGVYVPFNEAMCVGKVTCEIFSPEFNQCRCQAHQVTAEQYQEITLKPLEILFRNQFNHIILWFDDDMFCQINLLTLLAYLDQIKYSGRITYNLINKDFKLVNSYQLAPCGYDEKYKQVMIEGRMPLNIKLSVLENGIRLYLEYLKEDSEITEYINLHEDVDRNSLVMDLLRLFPQYGLGDTQYIQLINRCRKTK